MKKITIEKRTVIHDDDVGANVEVREDSDGLDLLEIRAEGSVITMDLWVARAVAQALAETADHIEKRITQKP